MNHGAGTGGARGHRQDDAGLVVREHDRDERGVVRQGHVGIEAAHVVDAQDVDFDRGPQRLERVQDGGMLDRRADGLPAARRAQRAEQRDGVQYPA